MAKKIMYDCSQRKTELQNNCTEMFMILEKYAGFFYSSNETNATLPRMKQRITPLAMMLEVRRFFCVRKRNLVYRCCFFECFHTDRIRFVESEEAMERHAVCLADNDRFFTGLVFNLT